jgi:AraC-like DNA-binding protein
VAADRFTVHAPARALLSDLGISPAHVLRRAGLPADLFARTPAQLTSEQYFALWRAIDAEADDPQLPLTIGQALSPEVFDPLLFAALCSPDLRAAAHRIAVYKQLIGPMSVQVTEAPDGITVAYRWPPPLRPPAVLALTELAFWVILARTGTRTPVRPLRISAPEPPADPRPYVDFLGAPVDRGPRESITFSAADADRPFLTADQGMWEFFEPELRRRLSELRSGATAAERVRAALLELLPAGSVSMDAVARSLTVSTRTLQRQLNLEGTTFQTVLNDTREALARHYLAHSGLTVREIAFLLGYEDPNSFYRAFHSWTGKTPAQAHSKVD